MYSAIALSSLLFVCAGLTSIVLDGERLTALASIAYGVVDFVWHECQHGSTVSTCRFHHVYYIGLLEKLDSFFQHTLIVYALTSILFSTHFFMVLSRSLITWSSFFLILSHRVNAEQADLVTSGMYIGLWITSHILNEHPQRRIEWTALLFLSFAIGYVLLQVTRIVRDDTWNTALICISHVSFAFGVICAAMCLRVVKDVKKTK